jgi:quercetin dioxygenase-like cupin family protein
MLNRSIALILAAALLVVCPAGAEQPYRQVQPLLSTNHSVLDEPLTLPSGGAMQVASSIITVNPGEATAWHRHGVPLYAYILEGDLSVDYGEQGVREYPAGTAFMEAMHQWHRGQNHGALPVRILAVYIGLDDAPAVIVRPEEAAGDAQR